MEERKVVYYFTEGKEKGRTESNSKRWFIIINNEGRKEDDLLS